MLITQFSHSSWLLHTLIAYLLYTQYFVELYLYAVPVRCRVIQYQISDR